MHLDLTLAAWAADGLLALFFFVAGLELKRVFVAGDLRDPRRAALPVAAAVGGMAVPALIFAVVAGRSGADALAGWAIPTATDIAFALAVLGITVPVRVRDGQHSPAEVFEHRWRPVSAGVAVPVFAFFAAGVSIAETGGLVTSLTDSITVGIIAALLVGKAIGITGSAWLVQRFTRARLADGLSWWDVFGLALLGGIGFTVSLLIGELAYGAGTDLDGYAKVGVLAGSLLSALAAAVVLRLRNRLYRRVCAEEELDTDADDVPDVYESYRSRP